MNNDLTAWDNATDSPTTAPGEVNTQDGYVLLLVLLSIFIGGTLVLLSGILIICRRCCETDRRHSRASDDPEKTNTTYLDDSQPPQEITIKVDDPDRLSASSYRDVETERFLSSSSATGRRVSFNEAALFEQSKKTQEKGRRYTLTEGDFHHLKNARLTHLPAPPPALRILTIHECASGQSSPAMAPRPPPPPPRPPLAICQPPGGALPQTALSARAMGPSAALPGDTYNSTVDTSFAEASPSLSSASGESPSFEGAAGGPKGAGAGGAGEPPPPPAQGTVLQFFTRLRRHASLEGASPYFRIKKWKLESSQRASSLDTRGSPKRRQFQRQRAASESMEQEDRDAHQTGIIQYIARTDDVAFRPMAGPFLPPPSSPPPSLGRLELAEAGGGGGAQAPGAEPRTIYHDIWSLRASLELSACSEQSNDRDSLRSEGGDSGGSAGPPAFPPSLDEAEGPEPEPDERPRARPRQASAEAEAGPRKLLQMDSGYASIEGPGRAGGEEGRPGDQTASEKRVCFTSAGRKGTIFESAEGPGPELEEEEEEEEEEGGAGGPLPRSPLAWPQPFPGREGPPRRDYSIDEKTEALFHAFLRHDPRLDGSPPRPRPRPRAQLRKQWQRAKQCSDPGLRFPPGPERHRPPLRRGESLGCPLEGRPPGPPPRLGPEEAGRAGEGAEAEAKIQAIEEEPPELAGDPRAPAEPPSAGERDACPGPGCRPPPDGLLDKIAGGLEERLYGRLRELRERPECLVAVASPDRSPV